MSRRKRSPRPRMVTGGGGNRAVANFGQRVERYGIRRAMRMGLMELGLPMAFVFPFVLLLLPLIQAIIQVEVQTQLQAQIAAILEKERKQREALLREAYRGIIPE